MDSNKLLLHDFFFLIMMKNYLSDTACVKKFVTTLKNIFEKNLLIKINAAPPNGIRVRSDC